jgi:hypothetical protein
MACDSNHSPDVPGKEIARARGRLKSGRPRRVPADPAVSGCGPSEDRADRGPCRHCRAILEPATPVGSSVHFWPDCDWFEFLAPKMPVHRPSSLVPAPGAERSAASLSGSPSERPRPATCFSIAAPSASVAGRQLLKLALGFLECPSALTMACWRSSRCSARAGSSFRRSFSRRFCSARMPGRPGGTLCRPSCCALAFRSRTTLAGSVLHFVTGQFGQLGCSLKGRTIRRIAGE